MSTSSTATGDARSTTPPDGPYLVKSLFDGCVLGVVGGSPQPGAQVATSDPDPGQTWRFVAVEPGWWYLRTEAEAALVMTLDTDQPLGNPPVVVASPERRDSQLWSLVPTEKLGYWYIQSKLGNYVVDVEGFKPGAGVPIIGFARKYRGFENQAWGFAAVQ